MITLRRYTHPCDDHMFGLDMVAEDVNFLNGYDESHFALATAVTYMGEKTGNKLSDILKFEYGANYEEKDAQVQMLLKKASSLDIKMICPLHGVILKENRVILLLIKTIPIDRSVSVCHPEKRRENSHPTPPHEIGTFLIINS